MNKTHLIAFVIALSFIFVFGGRSLSWAHAQSTTPAPNDNMGTTAEPRPNLPATNHIVYLPLVMRSGAQATPTATPPPTVTPPPTNIDVKWFMEPLTKTAGADIKVDAQGGLHIAYRYHVPDKEGTAAVYQYCPAPLSGCTDMNKWKGISLLNAVREVQLELNPQGKPRLLIQTKSTQYQSSAEDYFYVECDQNCTDPNNWNGTSLVTRYGDLTSINSYYLPERYFALDPQGRPRFIYSDRNYVVEPDHYGVYYVWCDAQCADASHWQEARITREVVGQQLEDWETISYPALAFTKDGRPRIVGDLTGLKNAQGERETGIFYLACDQNCDDETNWQRAKIAERGGGPFPMWSLAFDANDRPRVAFYKEATLAPDTSGKRLHYLQCNSGCTNASNWASLNLGLPAGWGEGVDLALDANGRPRMTYIAGNYNLGYAWCDGDCTQQSGWLQGLADESSKLEGEYPVARPTTCDAGIWRTHSPAMVLDGSGDPRIAYDASYQARCLYQDPNDPTKPPYYNYIEVWHTVRVLAFPKP